MNAVFAFLKIQKSVQTRVAWQERERRRKTERPARISSATDGSAVGENRVASVIGKKWIHRIRAGKAREVLPYPCAFSKPDLSTQRLREPLGRLDDFSFDQHLRCL